MPLIPSLLGKLYEHNLIKVIKDYARPIKHWLWERNNIYWVIDQIKKTRSKNDPVKIIFDVGSEAGDKTIVLLRTFPQAQIYCFEPREKIHKIFKKRIKKYQSRVKLFKAGLYNKNGQSTFYVYSHQPTSSILPITKYLNKEYKILKKITINIYTLDYIVEKFKIPKIDFLKIDVEGVEKEVLEGAKNSLRNKIYNVFVEISPLRKQKNSKDYIKIFSLLHDAGFSFIGCFGDYFFSKDKLLIKKFFGKSY